VGLLSYFDIAGLYKTYAIQHFVETGLGHGAGLRMAQNIPFKTLWSCEIEPSLYEETGKLFVNDPRIELFHGTSASMLRLLSRLPAQERILFWLDAHFPGADTGLRKYDSEPDPALRWPLETELNLIRAQRPSHDDVIIIDDARIWLDGPFSTGAIPKDLVEACRAPTRGIGFIEDVWLDTHTISIDYADTGYIVLRPRDLQDP